MESPMRQILLAMLGALSLTLAAAAQNNRKPGLDQFGDPLPKGAIARIGTLRWNGRIILDLAYSPDGKRLAAFCTKMFRARRGQWSKRRR